MKLSEQLKQDSDSGDFGRALEGYVERATELEELVRKYEADARRYQYLRDNQTWHRYGTLADDDSYAIVGCKFPYLANFECKTMLDYNIDKMLEKKGT